MFRTLVVPLDGSDLAERALPYAVRLARVGRGRVILMRAAMAAPPRSLDGSDWEADQTLAVREAEDYLSKIAAELEHVPTECVVQYGRAPAQIMQVVSDYHADAVVMATHGRTGLPHLLYGSVTEAVLADSGVPVLAVYAQPGQAPAAEFSPNNARLLVPQDGSANDAAALHTALEIVGAQGEIVLMTVISPAERLQCDENGRVLAYLDQQEEARRVEARDYLNKIADDVRVGRSPVGVKVDVRVGDPASRIALAAIEEAADLIVMASHGRTGLRRAVQGSVAGTVLRSTPTPVLLVHPTQTNEISGREVARQSDVEGAALAGRAFDR
jgi:nucleotide-binding universal stress UspA family protein